MSSKMAKHFRNFVVHWKVTQSQRERIICVQPASLKAASYYIELCDCSLVSSSFQNLYMMFFSFVNVLIIVTKSVQGVQGREIMLNL